MVASVKLAPLLVNYYELITWRFGNFGDNVRRDGNNLTYNAHVRVHVWQELKRMVKFTFFFRAEKKVAMKFT